MEVEKMVDAIGAMKVGDLIKLTQELEAKFRVKIIKPLTNRLSQEVERQQEDEKEKQVALVAVGQNRIPIIKMLKEKIG